MSKIVIEKNKPTNLKPDSWYEEYLEIEDLIPCKIPEDAQVFYFFKEGELKNKIIKEDIDGDNNIFRYKTFVNNNNLESNKELIEECRKKIQSLPIDINLEDFENIDENSWEARIIESIFKINKCEEILKQGYLITTQLLNIWGLIGECKYDLEEIKKYNKPILDVLQQFKFENYKEELSDLIKQNVGWRDKDRDFEIYQEIQNGKLLGEIAERLDCSISSISKINKKVQSSINNLKGKFFEIQYEKYLRDLNKFQNSEIVRDGNPGKPDIYITDNNNNLYVFSLKNLEVKRKSFTIIKDKLKPELEFALIKSTFEKFKNVELYLIVFDSLKEKIHIRQLDYNNPENINIYS